MASIRLLLGLLALSVLAAACSGNEVSDIPVVTRVLLPATSTPATTTTTVKALDPIEADHLAKTDLRRVLSVARELFAEHGTFDVPVDQVASLTSPTEVISLEDAAGRPGVVYDSHDQRATLHRRSASGRWFCIDTSNDGDDFGFGDSFESSLSTCTDRIFAAGWGYAFSPTGPDESAIKATLEALTRSLTTGDARSAHASFDSDSACSVSDLLEMWPDGLAVTESADIELVSMSVDDDRATVEAAYGSFPATWEFRKHEGQWRLATDPCEVLETALSERTSVAARELLERGLFAVRSSFVVRQDFAFSARSLEQLDGTLILVPITDLAYGTLSYQGTESRGLLATAAGPGIFYCAVESLSAETVYGTGATTDDIKTAGRCMATAAP